MPKGRLTMDRAATDPVRSRIGQCLAEIGNRADRLSPLDIHSRMDAIREIAAANGLAALESLAQRSAQLALLPGHRIATRCCLEHMAVAMDSRASADSTAILAALALRLH
jgi:hypothetical protein